MLAVVGSRGEALANRVDVPITTGAAATSWAAIQNTQQVLDWTGEKSVALLGFSGTVGETVAAGLKRAGVQVTATGRGRALARRAEDMGVGFTSIEEAVSAHKIVVGAGTTGSIVEPHWMQSGSVLVDVALPSSLKKGPRPPGLVVLAGEAMALPKGWTRGFWGRIYHLIAGYGPHQIYACLAEPMVMAAHGIDVPFAQGRKLSLEKVDAFGQAALDLGLQARLASGWKSVEKKHFAHFDGGLG